MEVFMIRAGLKVKDGVADVVSLLDPTGHPIDVSTGQPIKETWQEIRAMRRRLVFGVPTESPGASLAEQLTAMEGVEVHDGKHRGEGWPDSQLRRMAGEES